MKNQLWLILLLGFGILVLLVAFSGVSALHRASETYAGISRLYDSQHRTERHLDQLRSGIQTSAILIRDFLLDLNASVPATRLELQRLQQQTSEDMEQIRRTIPASDAPRLSRLQEQVEEYWRSIDPVLHWNAEQKVYRSAGFLKAEVLPRRKAVLSVLGEIQQLTDNSLRTARRNIDAEQSKLPFYVGLVVVPATLTALLVAALSLIRIYRLEAVADRQKEAMAFAENELRHLSQQLVRVHEEERKSLSRELHDQVGQILTAIRINLGNLEEAMPGEASLRYPLDQTKRLSEQALRSVRDLAMGLRPAMLDDLGLGAALEWQARQHARVCKVPVTTSIDGDLTELSDAHRTCVYRIVQEALTNSARHAQAKEIRLQVACRDRSVSIGFYDDGCGFDMHSSNSGLGLVGMKERVRELGGQIAIHSTPGKGTSILVTIPLGGIGAKG